VKQLPSKIIVNLNVNANDIDNRLIAGDIQMDQAGSVGDCSPTCGVDISRIRG
jgi:hypothetical protein